MRMWTRVAFLPAVVLLSAFLLVPAGAATPDPKSPANPAAPTATGQKPRLFLVLSGGGARGAAHIGVLKVLEEMHVPVEMVVGTSMGSIIGGLYATGWTPDEMETFLKSVDWNQVFFDRVDRDEKTYRRRQDDSAYFIKAKIRFKGWKPYIPKGVLGGQRLELMLKGVEFESTGEQNFDKFPIPYRAVAADLTENEAYVIDHGSLATAMRASMSIAGAFAPVEIEGHVLVDGGAVANLPIGIAQSLGADALIAVDISSPLSGQEDLVSFLSVTGQMSSLLTTGNRREDIKRLRPQDVLIIPELGDISFSDFPRATEAIAIGEKAARAAADRLKAYAVGDAEWAAYKARHHKRPASELVVDRFDAKNKSLVDDDIVRAHIEVPLGQPYDQKTFTRDVMRLYALDYFGPIRPSFERDAGKGDLSIDVPPKPYGRSSLQLGLAFSNDLQGESAATITARHLLLAANRRGGEWENVLQVGERMGLVTRFYQPLDAGMKWFAEPGASILKTTQGLWTDGSHVADYTVKLYGAKLDAGRTLGRWGEVSVGGFVDRSRGEVLIGPDVAPPFAETDGGLRLNLGADTLDSVVFPRRGWRLNTTYSYSLENFGADIPGGRAYASILGAIGIGRSTVVPHLEYGDNFRTPVNYWGKFPLGGLWRLSGLAQNELIGERAALGSVIFYQEIMKAGLGVLRTSIYAGGSLEYGGVFDDPDPFSLSTMNTGGSIFVGADTVIGPAYLACGFAEGGRRRYYLSIGQTF